MRTSAVGLAKAAVRSDLYVPRCEGLGSLVGGETERSANNDALEDEYTATLAHRTALLVPM